MDIFTAIIISALTVYGVIRLYQDLTRILRGSK